MFKIRLYPYQREIAEKLLRLVIHPHSVRKATGNGATHIKHLEILISRQAGKTEVIVLCVAYLMVFYPVIKNKPLRTIIFGPQREQTKTDFDRLKERLGQLEQAGFGAEIDTEESNATTLKLANGAITYTFPLTETSKIESKTGDLLIFEEANAIDNRQKRVKADPMRTATNGPEISIGVGGYSINYFQERCLIGENLVKADDNRVMAERRELYEQDGNDWHLNYEKAVLEKRAEWGEVSDEYQTQYRLNWKLGTGQFCTAEQWDSLKGVPKDHKANHGCVAGLDTAKSPDRTVLKIKCRECQQLIGGLELLGENYQDQFDIITQELGRHKTIALAIDSTGQGDFMPDLFERHSKWSDEMNGLYRVKFTLQGKHDLYKNLQTVILNKLTSIPEEDTDTYRRFKKEMIDLQKEYKGQYLSVHHPDDPNAHDDHPDAWALAEWADHQYSIHGEPEIFTM